MENKQQTALQKAIEEIKSMAGEFENQRIPAVLLLSKILPLLKDEREQIIEAFDCDVSPEPGEEWISNGQQYYNKTYGKKSNN